LPSTYLGIAKFLNRRIAELDKTTSILIWSNLALISGLRNIYVVFSGLKKTAMIYWKQLCRKLQLEVQLYWISRNCEHVDYRSVILFSDTLLASYQIATDGMDLIFYEPSDSIISPRRQFAPPSKDNS